MKLMITTDPATAVQYGLLLGAGMLIILLLLLFSPLMDNPGAILLGSALLTGISMLAYSGIVLYLDGYAFIPGYFIWIGLGLVALFVGLFIRAHAKRGVVLLFVIVAISMASGIFGSIGLQALDWVDWEIAQQYWTQFVVGSIVVFLLLATLIRATVR